MEVQRQGLVAALATGQTPAIRRAAREFYEAREADRRAHDFLVGLLGEGMGTSITSALFDGVFEGAIALDDDLLFSLLASVRTRAQEVPEETPSERRAAEARVWQWCYSGFLRIL